VLVERVVWLSFLSSISNIVLSFFQTPGFFVKDQIKSLVIFQLIKLPFVALGVYIIHNGGEYFFVYLWACLTVLGFAFMTIYPEFIAPLFDKYTPLPEGELRTRIEKLASSLKFPLYKLYIVEGEKLSIVQSSSCCQL